MGTILVKSALNALKLKLKKKISLKKFNLVNRFLLFTFFEILSFSKHSKHFLLKLCPFFVSWFWGFVKRYEFDLMVIFDQWPKLHSGFDVLRIRKS